MIQDIYIESYEERYAPPEQPVMRVSVVGGIAFISIGKYAENNRASSFVEIRNEKNEGGGMGVPLEDLLEALSTLEFSNKLRHKRIGTPDGPL